MAFDVETTGLSAASDRLTEIGAVLFSGGKVLDTFSTFVDPGMHIPANITELTGIKDSDVAGAPSEAEAMRAFLDFCGGRPLIAHNAAFDTGLHVRGLRALRDRVQPRRDRHPGPRAAASARTPEAQAGHSQQAPGPPGIQSPQAFDDAEVVARMMEKFIPMLRSHGAEKLSDVNEAVSRLSGSGGRKVRHITLLVRSKRG